MTAELHVLQYNCTVALTTMCKYRYGLYASMLKHSVSQLNERMNISIMQQSNTTYTLIAILYTHALRILRKEYFINNCLRQNSLQITYKLYINAFSLVENVFQIYTNVVCATSYYKEDRTNMKLLWFLESLSLPFYDSNSFNYYNAE